MELVVFLILLAILVFVELEYYQRHALDDLQLNVRFSKSVANYDEVIEVIETAQNNKKLPLPFLILKFETPTSLRFMDMSNISVSDMLYREDMLTMKPFSRHTRKIKARCTKRGYYTFSRVNISTSDILLVLKLNREFENSATLTVLPERVKSDTLRTLMSVTYSETVRRRTLLTDPFSFAGIREYMPGDPMKTINWAATARSADFMVNQNASTACRRVTVVLNLDTYNPKRSRSLLEYSISLAYSYICELEEMNIRSSLITNGLDILSGSPVITHNGSTGDDAARVGTGLALIDLDRDTAPFERIVEDYVINGSEDDLIVVISARYDDEFINTMKCIKRIKDSCIWVMPCYRQTPAVEIDASLGNSYIRLETVGHD